MKDRTQQAGIITLAEFFRFGVKSIVGVLLARLITPSELGSYRQLFLIYTTFSTLMMMGIPQSLLYFLPKYDTDLLRKIHVSRIKDLSFALSIVFAVCLILFRGVIAAKFNNPLMAKLLLIYALYPVFMFSSSLYSYVMLGHGNATAAAKFTIFSISTDAVLILGTAILSKDLTMIVSAVVAASSLQWLYSRIMLRGFKAPPQLDIPFYRKQFSYALPLGLSSIIGMLSIQLDKFVISAFFDPASFAVFSIGAMELPFISILTNSVNSVLLPGISAAPDKTALSDIFRAAVRKNAIFIFPTALLCYLYAPQIISILYTDTYLAAVPYFRIYLYLLPMRIATLGMIFMALGKTRVIMWNAIFTLVCNLILNLILVRHYGMMGAAIATVIMTALSVLLYVILIKAQLGLKLSMLIPWLPLLRTAVAASLATLAAWSLIRHQAPLIMQLIALPVFAAVFLASGYLLGAILPYDLRTALNFAKGLSARFFVR